MNRHRLLATLLVCLLPVAANAGVIINPHAYSSIDYGNSWDNPTVNVDQVLSGLSFSGDIHLTLLNGYAGEIESWFGKGAATILIEEIAGYAGATTFGWYNTANPGAFGQLFAGAASAGATASATFDPAIDFGFYIDPNGKQNDRLFTQHLLNPNGSYQATIFAIDELPGQYILGWEDLVLTGPTDKDYQDMIVRVSVSSVPEPGTLALMMLGFAGLSLSRRRKAVAA
jgi:hypothetical protein